MRFKFYLLFLTTLFLNISFAQISPESIQNSLKKYEKSHQLQQADLENILITDNYTSRGQNHIYFKQTVNGIEIYESYGALHGEEDNLKLDDSGILKGLKNYSIDGNTALPFENILEQLVIQRNYPKNYELKKATFEGGASQKESYISDELSFSPIKTRLVYYQDSKGHLTIGRIIILDEKTSDDYFEFLVDGITGIIINKVNYTLSCNFEESPHFHHSSTKKEKSHNHDHALLGESPETKSIHSVAPNQYQVYAYPLESPLNGSQTIVTAPWLEGTASPNGWHTIGVNNYTTTVGNNVDAYLDSNNSNAPTNGDGDRANGGPTLEFLFPYDTTTSATSTANKNAALTNLFYWNNIIHDVWSEYGFDEASGNFQQENYGPQGSDGDYVRAEAQDGGGTCNANMSTPADGSRPRMQMYLCNGRDGDVDNGVVIHEYTHGISNRLTGGPSQSACLQNQEQMGEGWSDFFAIIMTIEPGDTGTDLRPMGNWLTGAGINGSGIRTYPYTTDLNENPFTYDDIKTLSAPHGVGSVWATMLWDLAWAFIDEYGFDPDLYNGTGGNNMVMELVIEGMKIQPCSPGFVDGRDAILQADLNLFGGVNKCMIWQVFADRGLGYSASQGSSNNKSDGSEAFDLDPSCSVAISKTANVTEVEPGGNIMYTLSVTNNSPTTKSGLILSDKLPENTSFVSANNGGILDGNRVTFPAFSLNATQNTSYSFEVMVDGAASPNVADFVDDMESGAANWTVLNSGSCSFNLSSASSSSGSFSWFANDGSFPGVATITVASTQYISSSSKLTFSHSYNTEVNWDGGQVYISSDNGQSWTNLGPYMTVNGYNGLINNSSPGFSGNSGGFITTSVDLSAFAGQPGLIRFEMNCDQSIGGLGWYIDDVIVDNQSLFIPNTAELVDGAATIFGHLATPTTVIESSGGFTIQVGGVNPLCNGESSGKAYVTPINPTGPFNISWANGMTTDTIFNLPAGLYQVTVTDANTSKSGTVNLIDPSIIQANLSSTNAPLGTGGTATANPSGGTPPYTFLWNTNETTPTISDLSDGTYTVTITDSNNCEEIDMVDVIDPSNCLENLIIVEVLMDAFPEDISIIVRDDVNNIIFENGPYSSVPDGSTVTEYICVPDGCVTIEIDDAFGDGLCLGGGLVGNYKITDGFTNRILFEGCDIGSGIIHDLCYPLLNYTITKSDPSCVGLLDGNIDLTLVGGNPSPSVAYNTGATTEDLTNIGPGLYTVVINDGVTIFEDTIQIYNSKASVYKVNGNNQGSLEFAVNNACLTDTIVFESNLMNQTIYPNNTIFIKNNQVIKGFGMNELMISGSNNIQIFNIQAGFTATIMDLQLLDGYSTVDGGAIKNSGKLYLNNVKLSNNFEGSSPKAITNYGQLFIKSNTEID